MFLKYPYIFLCVLSIITISCDDLSHGEGKIDEGIIEYSITYPRLADDDVLLELLPNKMEMTFKDNSYRNDIVAGMGLFRTSIISDKESNEFVHTVKMLNTKYASKLEASDLKYINPNFFDVDIEFTGDSKRIAGFGCEEIKVHIQGDSTWTYKAYYTTEISIENPNRNTPFEEVKGVLMDYQLINYGIHMHFTAQSVFPKEVDNPILVLDEDYKMISPVALGNEIESIFAKIK